MLHIVLGWLREKPIEANRLGGIVYEKLCRTRRRERREHECKASTEDTWNELNRWMTAVKPSNTGRNHHHCIIELL